MAKLLQVSVDNPLAYAYDDAPPPKVMGLKAAMGCTHSRKDADETGCCPCPDRFVVDTNKSNDWHRSRTVDGTLLGELKPEFQNA